MTTLSNAEGRALLKGQTGKNKPKAAKPPPIRMPKESKPETLRHQLDQSEVELAFQEITIRTNNGSYVEHGPTSAVIISRGIEFELKLKGK